MLLFLKHAEGCVSWVAVFCTHPCLRTKAGIPNVSASTHGPHLYLPVVVVFFNGIPVLVKGRQKCAFKSLPSP